MGTGWDTDFPKLHRGSSPDLFVNVINSVQDLFYIDGFVDDTKYS